MLICIKSHKFVKIIKKLWSALPLYNLWWRNSIYLVKYIPWGIYWRGGGGHLHTWKLKGSMFITHVFSRNVTYKKHKKRKMFSPHRNHDIHYYFSRLVVQHTKWKKKLFNVITHAQKFIMKHKNLNRIIEMFIGYIYI